MASVTMAIGGLAMCASGAAAAERPPVIVVVRGGGFNWGDAAIGAAAGFGVALAAFGAMLTIKGSDKKLTGGTRHG